MSFELEDFCSSPATLSEVATLAFRNRGGGVELFFFSCNKNLNSQKTKSNSLQQRKRLILLG